jgi:hypothetical protein
LRFQSTATPAEQLIPEERESRFFAADTSGIACLNHDSFDLDSFDQAISDYPNFLQTIEESGGTLSTGSALMRDLFWSFHKRAPMIAPPAPLKHSYEVNRQILEQVMNTIEWWPSHRLLRLCGECKNSGIVAKLVKRIPC